MRQWPSSSRSQSKDSENTSGDGVALSRLGTGAPRQTVAMRPSTCTVASSTCRR